MTDNGNFSLSIKNFKNIKEAQFGFTPLSILTGVNSGGKSSVIQALLLSISIAGDGNSELNEIVSAYNNFEISKNHKLTLNDIELNAINPDFIELEIITTNKKPIKVSIDNNSSKVHGNRFELGLLFDVNLFYLSANRIGPEHIAKMNNNSVVGIDGCYLFGFYEKNKKKQIQLSFKDFDFNESLFEVTLTEWMKIILGFDITLNTRKLSADSAWVQFKINDIEFDPRNVGAGNSYLAKILIMCLQAKRGDYVIIENPEIHLHPKAQAKLGEFFAKLVDAGVNLIIETHSEHIINKIRYCVYKKIIPNKNVAIYYKPSIADDFIHLKLNENGRYIDPDGNRRDFPEGFFDATLDDLMSIRNG